MKPNDFNNHLRNIFSSLLSDGFLKSDLSNVTFGNNRQDQLKEFLAGRNLGLKPLNKIFEPLGFEFHMVPILKSKVKDQELVNNMANDALESIRWILLDYLENLKAKKREKSGIAEFADSKIGEIKKS